MNYSITQYGKPLSPDKYIWDAATKTLVTAESDLVLDFSDVDRVTFRTGSNCTFKTGYNCAFQTGSSCTFSTGNGCTFKTDSCCTFNTGHDCTFKTGYNCTFKTGYNCTFDTGYSCAFNTGSYCTFKTGHNCTFDTGTDCTFKTGVGCTFKTGFDCTFKTGKNCSLIRYDVDGITELPVDTVVKLNGYGIVGYTIIEEKKTVKLPISLLTNLPPMSSEQWVLIEKELLDAYRAGGLAAAYKGEALKQELIGSDAWIGAIRYQQQIVAHFNNPKLEIPE
jgi:hypothetical protein